MKLLLIRNLDADGNPIISAKLSVRATLPSSAAQQDDDVDEEQTDEDEGEVDEQLLQVPLGLRVHLDL